MVKREKVGRAEFRQVFFQLRSGWRSLAVPNETDACGIFQLPSVKQGSGLVIGRWALGMQRTANLQERGQCRKKT